jgi:hypothetical protein
MRELATFLGSRPGGAGGQLASLLNVVGLEKSGPFVEHAIQIEDRLRPGSVLLLPNDYIYRYIIPGDPNGADPYGKNTYWGGKLIYKAHDGNVYVATVPTGQFRVTPQYDDFLNLTDILAVLGERRCSMYDNALIPIALATAWYRCRSFRAHASLRRLRGTASVPERVIRAFIDARFSSPPDVIIPSLLTSSEEEKSQS